MSRLRIADLAQLQPHKQATLDKKGGSSYPQTYK